MNKQDFQKLLDQTHQNMKNLTASKGEEYARDADQLANFKRQAEQCEVSRFIVWLVYFNKHLDAIISFISSVKSGKSGPALSEPIESRIDDAILYLILLKALIKDLYE